MAALKKAGIILLLASVAFTGQRVHVVSFNEMQKAVKHNNDTLYVVNYWSTWCAPCVKELPYFQAAYKKYASRKIKMIYVSLNPASSIAEVEKFAEAKDLKPDVMLLSDNNPNVWIDKVDSSWSGAIPATVLYRHGKKLYFHEGDFDQEKLNTLIQSKLK